MSPRSANLTPFYAIAIDEIEGAVDILRRSLSAPDATVDDLRGAEQALDDILRSHNMIARRVNHAINDAAAKATKEST